MNTLVVAVSAAAAVVGVLVVASAWSPPSPRPHRLVTRLQPSGWALRAAVGVVAGLVVLAATGWAVAAVASSVALGRWRPQPRRRQRDEQARVEALASWCEQLRDLLSADHGVQATVEASVVTCPSVLRPAVSRLATGLARQAPEVALYEFASAVDDPAADLVASVLLLALSRSGRTAELLSELAATTRERAAMRLRIAADRAGEQTEARIVIGFAAAAVVAVVVFGRGTEFLAAYDTASGQAVLAAVAVLYATGMWWLHRLTRFERPARFLAPPSDRSQS